MPPPSHSNLNSRLPDLKLQAGAGGVRAVGGIKLGASAIQDSAPPVRIVGGSRRYRGGYFLNV